MTRNSARNVWRQEETRGQSAGGDRRLGSTSRKEEGQEETTDIPRRQSTHISRFDTLYTYPTARRFAAPRKESILQAAAMQASEEDIKSFVDEFLASWTGTDENKILAYYADDIVLHTPTGTLNGKMAVRDNFVCPFITAFPGNVNVIVNIAYGKNLVAIEGALRARTQAPSGASRQQANRCGFPAAPSTNTTSRPG